MQINLKTKLSLTLLFIFILSIIVFSLSYFGQKSKNEELTSGKIINSALHDLTFQITKSERYLWTTERQLLKKTKPIKALLKHILKKNKINEFIIFNEKAKVTVKNGELNLPPAVDAPLNFQTKNSKIEFRNFWKSLVIEFKSGSFYLDTASKNNSKLYIPFKYKNKEVSWIFLANLGEEYFNTIFIPEDPNFWLRWILGIILILFISLASFFILYSAMVRPVYTLNNTLTEMNQGNLSSVIALPRTNDEFGSISEKLNSLADTLERLKQVSQNKPDENKLEHSEKDESPFQIDLTNSEEQAGTDIIIDSEDLEDILDEPGSKEEDKKTGEAPSPEIKKILEKGKSLYKDKQFADALSYFEDYLQKNENDLEGLIYYSDTLLHMDNNEKSLENYKKVVRDVPQDPDIHFKIGLLNYRLGNLGDSAIEMEKAIELKTSYGDAWLYAGVSYANQGNYDEALSILEKAQNEGIYEDEVSSLIKEINELKK